jgi:hypothetical protein
MNRGRRPAILAWSLFQLFAVSASILTCAPGTKAQSAAPKKDDGGPTVVSEAKRKEQKKGSEFLRPPGSDRYDPGPDDDDLPWRQATFFGIKAKGQRFIYVVDCSGSMIDEARLTRAKDEVRRSIMRLQPPQRFKVIFYNDQPLPMPGDLTRSADLNSKAQLFSWLRLIEPDGGTDPRAAVAQALSLRPDAVFLLSDGEFPDGTVEAVAKSNARKIPIHCVDLSGGGSGDQLKQIARDSGGRYAPRPWRGE